MWDLQHIISIWRRRYWQIFKSALVYLLLFLFYFGFFFCTCILTNSRLLISNISKDVQIYWPKYQNNAFLVPFFVVAVTVVVVLLDFCYLDKLESADFKYDISFFKFQSKNTQKRPFWSKFKNFYFCTKFYVLINLRALISNILINFHTYSTKLHKSDIFGLRFKIFLFCIKYWLMT